MGKIILPILILGVPGLTISLLVVVGIVSAIVSRNRKGKREKGEA
ncbi:MAG: hypothetical protein ACFFGZ_15220 [Candidatus Thorarchaeota archaeon]